MTGSVLFSKESATVPITYIEADGTERTVQAKIGSNLLDTAHDNGVELEGRKLSGFVVMHRQQVFVAAVMYLVVGIDTQSIAIAQYVWPDFLSSVSSLLHEFFCFLPFGLNNK